MVATASAADLKARYPEFTPVDDALINLVIAEAAPMVDDGWEATDQKPGILALTAHLLSMEGWPKRVSNPTGPIPSTAGREVIMRKVGDVSTQYAQSAASSGGGSSGLMSSLTLTPYGNRFRQLLKLNAPAIALV